jgi:hypothetical protein
VPRLLALEKFIFDELVSYVWTHTLVPKAAAARARPAPGAPGGKRGAHEAAVRKWIEALEAAHAQLVALGREGHVSVLQHQVGRGRARLSVKGWHCVVLGRPTTQWPPPCHSMPVCSTAQPLELCTAATQPPPLVDSPHPPPLQVLLELLKRVDALLFHYLATPPPADADADGEAGAGGASPGHGPGSSGSSSPGRGSPGRGSRGSRGGGGGGGYMGPPLDDSMLLFPRGSLTFTAGLQLKQACTRWVAPRVQGRVKALAAGRARRHQAPPRQATAALSPRWRCSPSALPCPARPQAAAVGVQRGRAARDLGAAAGAGPVPVPPPEGAGWAGLGRQGKRACASCARALRA